MDREQTIVVISLLKTAYPRFYVNMTKEEAERTISLWQVMFKNESPEVVIVAVKNLINSFKFPPTIADIKDEIYKLKHVEDKEPMELYALIKKAIRNGIYGSAEEFKRLPDVCQKFVGSPAQLRTWAMDENFNDSVLRGQFIKQIETIKAREKEKEMMLPETKAVIDKLLEKTNSIKYLN